MAKFETATLDTVGAYISDARTLLQDTISPYRYDDPSLLVCLNSTLLEGRRLRADLFVYHGDGGVPSYTEVDDEEVNIEAPFRLAFVYGIVAHALMRDQEDIDDARASMFMSAFNSMLVGQGAAKIVTPPGHNQPPPAQPGRP